MVQPASEPDTAFKDRLQGSLTWSLASKLHLCPATERKDFLGYDRTMRSIFALCAYATILITPSAHAADGCSLAEAQELAESGWAYASKYRAMLPHIEPADDKMFNDTMLVYPVTPTIQQIRNTPAYNAWRVYKSGQNVESALIGLGAMNDKTSRLGVLAAVASLGISAEDSYGGMSMWLKYNRDQRDISSDKEALDLQFLTVKLQYTAFIMSCEAIAG